jgi:hypothetical protein
VVIPDQSADLQIFERDDIVLAQQGECCLVVDVAPLALYPLVVTFE